jgi:protocatechuate 3,4-dioxygenase beta subunit
MNTRTVGIITLASAVVLVGVFLIFSSLSQGGGSTVGKYKLLDPIGCVGAPIPDPAVDIPDYKEGSPERTNIAEGQSGDPLTLTGYVMTADCKPIAGAWVDFWQVDANGNYSDGNELRGHQLTDEEGKYTLNTIMPVNYEGRARHINFRVRAGDGRLTESQVYFPGEYQNLRDDFFIPENIVRLTEDHMSANFDIVIQI